MKNTFAVRDKIDGYSMSAEGRDATNNASVIGQTGSWWQREGCERDVKGQAGPGSAGWGQRLSVLTRTSYRRFVESSTSRSVDHVFEIYDPFTFELFHNLSAGLLKL